jgi:uncharacterized protein YprB with RNaseH-like and TPR domain/ribosomal protein S18 acetylase RimI-like enzyme
MKGNLRNRLLLIREMEGRKNAADAGTAASAAPGAAVSRAASVTGIRAAPPQPEKAPLNGVSPPPLPGWENAGFLAARRAVTLDFPHPLPPVFPRSMGIPAPDFFGYFAHPAVRGEARPEDLCFFDLETTGLSSGAGTVAFLAAFGRFVPASGGRYTLRVNQYLLLDYPGEGDFLEAALKEFGGDEAPETPGEIARPPLVVTYNGKTFDAQILKTRCLMNAVVPPDYCHADLLHPARRLWKRVLPSCSQAAVETAVLGLDRSGDIPGSEAPDIWFDFLKTGRTEALYGICDHNIRDIYGLARLLAALAEIAASPLEALEKYRCDAERLALRWWNICRGERFGAPPPGPRDAGTPAYGDEFERGKSLLDYAAKKGWMKALLVRMMDAEWRLKDPVKALALVNEALALESVQEVRVQEPDRIPVTAGIPLPEEFRDSLLHRRERLLRKIANMRGKIVIRLMTTGDYDGAVRLWKGVSGVAMRALDDSREGIAKFLERNPRSCFVAVPADAADRIFGVILAGHDGRRAYIYHTTVGEEYRGKGVGRSLVEAVERAMTAEGISRIALLAFKSNEAGNRFWEKLGFAEREDIVCRNRDLNRKNTYI